MIDPTSEDRRELLRYIRRYGADGISVAALERRYPVRSLRQRLQALAQTPALEVDPGQPLQRVVLDPPEGGCRQRVRVVIVVDKAPRLEQQRLQVPA